MFYASGNLLENFFSSEFFSCLMCVRPCLSQCSVSVQRPCDQGYSYKGSIHWGGLAYSFRGLIYYHQSGEHIGRQAVTEAVAENFTS